MQNYQIFNTIWNASNDSFTLTIKYNIRFNIKDLYFCSIKKCTMDIKLILHGKTDESFLQEGILKYSKRLKHYISFSELIIPALKNAKSISFQEIKQKEGELLLAKIQPADILVLLDERGNTFSSVEFSAFLQKQMNQSIKSLVFVVGGPYGFSNEVYQRANHKLSLSKMTFSHQMVRLLFVEQIYRAFTILNNEPYHHE